MDYHSFLKKYANHPNYSAPIGNELNAKSWQTEAPLRMFLNNLNEEVAEDPNNLIVYGGSGQAARNVDSAKKIIMSWERLPVTKDTISGWISGMN